jgi:hypothetical protein
MEPREQELEEIFAECCEGAFGGEIGSVNMIGAAACLIGAEELIGKLA